MTTLGSFVVLVVVVHLVLSLIVADYGRQKGYPWFPVLVATFFLGEPLPLFVVGIASRHQPQQTAEAIYDEFEEIEAPPIRPATQH